MLKRCGKGALPGSRLGLGKKRVESRCRGRRDYSIKDGFALLRSSTHRRWSFRSKGTLVHMEISRRVTPGVVRVTRSVLGYRATVIVAFRRSRSGRATALGCMPLPSIHRASKYRPGAMRAMLDVERTLSRRRRGAPKPTERRCRHLAARLSTACSQEA